jgi:signal transduction histidine kinase
MPVAPAARHLLALDAVVALALLVLGEVALLTNGTGLPVWLSAGLTALYTGPLAARRRFPATVCVVSVTSILALGLFDAAGSQPTIPLAIALATYSLGAYTAPPKTWMVASLSLASIWVGQLVTGNAAVDLAVTTVIYGGPLAFGAALRARGARAAQQATRAVADERARIARELHDIVAHSLSVVTLQTQAVRRRLGSDHEPEAESLQAVERTAREALEEMRRLLGALRVGGDEPAPLTPQPGLSQIDTLVEQTRRAGIAVEVLTSGERPRLNPGLDLAGYRVVQEALTNVRRHASASRVRVDLRYTGEEVAIEVGDDGSGHRPGGPGNGLIGMRERVELYGGSLETGSRPGGGYLVRARLPIRAAS